MFLNILLGVTIALHFIAASVAIKLTRVTKYNLSWMLITAALGLTAMRLLLEFIPRVTHYDFHQFDLFSVWIGIIASLFLAVGVYLIGKIFKYIKEVEIKKRDYEKRLLTAVIETEERERKQFAGDLHDGLGPVLSSIKLSLSSINPDTSEEQKARVLANVDVMVNEAIKSIKEISDHLSPHVLTNFGIEKALRNFVNKIHIAGKLKVLLNINLQNRRFPSNIEIVIYRVACELITNTYRHSGASLAKLTVAYDHKTLSMNYQDDGKGFDLEKVWEEGEGSGMGCYNIFSRVESLKGEVTFDKNVKKGIFVAIQIPIHE
jgi:signal transduction histidine kinase